MEMSEKLSKEDMEIISQSLVVTNEMLDTILHNDKSIDVMHTFCITITINYVKKLLDEVNTEIKGDVKNE
jgi:hypothetical protein